MSEHETHARVIAQIHEYANETDFCAHGNQSVRERIVWMAGRLEAAHKREIDALFTKSGENVNSPRANFTCGKQFNAAVLLKAMNDIYRIASNAHSDFDVFAGIERIYKISSRALAAPARNCDSYDSADEMMEKYADYAFLEEWKKWRETGKCHSLMLDAFLCISWLFLTNERG